jgi:hypothetical protein
VGAAAYQLAEGQGGGVQFLMPQYIAVNAKALLAHELKVMTQVDMITRVAQKGERPSIDSTIPPPLQSIMVDGWAKDPKARPQMKAIVKRIEDFARIYGVVLDVSQK